MMDVLIKQHHMDINARDNKGQTFLIRAGIDQNHEAMKTLINLGANIRITDNTRENVLHKIARKGDHEAAKIVLEYDKNVLHDRNKDGNSALLIALINGYTTFAEFLIDSGASLNDINDDGNTIIHEIVKKNSSWLLKKIVKKVNQDIINHKNKDGMSPLLIAATADDLEIVKTLVDCRANLYATNKYGDNIAHVAAGNGNIALLRFLSSRKDLLNALNNNRENAFVCGAKSGKLEVVKLLLAEEHFIKGDVQKIINDLRIYNSYEQLQVYTYLLNLHDNRIDDCEAINAIITVTSNLITHNNNVSKTLSEKTDRPYHPESLYLLYSISDLYKMTQSERNNIKNIALERQNRELITKNTLEQRLQAIVVEEQRKELARIDALKRRTEPEHIAAQQGTTIAEQKKELDRIAADKYAADIAKYNQQVIDAQKAQEQKNDAVPSVTISERVPFCCICFEEDIQLLKKIPCKNVHSDHICGACLAAPSVKTCPTCRGELTK